jgi:hypothetical protein
MAQEEFEQIEVTTVRGRKGVLDPADCSAIATVYADQIRVRVDGGGADPVFWMELTVPLAGTPAAPKPVT